MKDLSDPWQEFCWNGIGYLYRDRSFSEDDIRMESISDRLLFYWNADLCERNLLWAGFICRVCDNRKVLWCRSSKSFFSENPLPVKELFVWDPISPAPFSFIHTAVQTFIHDLGPCSMRTWRVILSIRSSFKKLLVLQRDYLMVLGEKHGTNYLPYT